jgi:hypothetical protein
MYGGDGVLGKVVRAAVTRGRGYPAWTRKKTERQVEHDAEAGTTGGSVPIACLYDGLYLSSSASNAEPSCCQMNDILYCREQTRL